MKLPGTAREESQNAWSFWQKWYDAALEGATLGLDALGQVARIETEDWTAGPKVVARRIRWIEQEAGESFWGNGRFEAALAKQEAKVALLENLVSGLHGEVESVEDSLRGGFDGILARMKEHYRGEFESALEAFIGQNAFKAPVHLWSEKEKEHSGRKLTSFWLFVLGLVIIVSVVLGLLGFSLKKPELLQAAFAPFGCDIQAPSTCTGFSFRWFLFAGAVLTMLTVLLWFARLQMKVFLSERHLAIDARERRAFAQAYVGLLAQGDTSDEAKEQRAIVYASLFRPSSDGIVKDDGGLDPALTAAISKLLAK